MLESVINVLLWYYCELSKQVMCLKRSKAAVVQTSSLSTCFVRPSLSVSAMTLSWLLPVVEVLFSVGHGLGLC